MAIEDDFADLYTRHVYKDGATAGEENSLLHPRGLARAINYGGVMPNGQQYPFSTGVDAADSFLQYSLGGGPAPATLDASPPSYILEHTIKPFRNLEESMIAASLIEKRQSLTNTNLRLFGARSSSVLRDRGRIP